MSPTKKFNVWLTAIALLVAMVLTPLAAGAKPPASKVWNIYQDKLGAYTVTSSAPKGQTLIEGPFPTQAEATAALTQPPVIEYALNPASPNGANGWYSSGNVGLTWNVYVPGSPGKSLVVTGDPNQTVSTDGVFTFTKSATAVGGSAGPVNVAIKRDATQPVLNVGPGIAQGASFEVGSVPAEPTFAPTDATSGVDTSNLTGYGVTIGTHTLTATATDFAGNVATELIGYTVTPHQAIVVEPTKVDQQFSGTPGIAIPGGLNIPTVAGIDYSIDGTLAAGGFVEMPPSIYQVTAVAQPDYELVGYPVGGWALEVLAADVTVHVTPGIPTATDETAGALGFITIPATTGVNYLIDGNPASAGDNPLPAGDHVVTAEAQPFYILDGTTSWPLTINAYVPPPIEATALPPIAVDPTEVGGMGSIEVLAVTGVDYFVGGNPVSGVTPFAPGNYQVTAAPQAGYVLVGDTSWPVTINEFVPPIIEVTAAAPTATDQTANASGFITIPTSVGVDYALDGAAVLAGNHDVAPGPHAVVATAQPGYALLGQTSWNLTVNAYVPPKQIQFIGSTGGDLGGQTLTLPAGWASGDLAVAFVARNTGGATSVPPLPAGWTNWSNGYTSTTYPYSAYRLMYRVLQPGDTTWTLTMSYRGAAVMVYRNATPGAAVGYASRSTAAINLIIPALTVQAPGTSWVGGFGYMDNTVVRDRPPVSPLAANRMIGVVPSSSMVGGWDTAGAVSAFPNTTLQSGYYTAMAAASFELKLVP
jgi:hypothetical protein